MADRTRRPRPFGKMPKKPRGQNVKKMKEKILCSYCKKPLEGCPNNFSYAACKSFLEEFDKTHTCHPRHCQNCSCMKCVGASKSTAEEILMKKIMCSYCNKSLQGCPNEFSYAACKSFLEEYDKNHTCYPRHCEKCYCTKCFGSDTASSAPNASSTEGFESDSFSELSSESSNEQETTSNDSSDEQETYSKGSIDEQDSYHNDSDPDFVPDTTFSSSDSDEDSYEHKIKSNMNEFRIINLEQMSKHVSDITLHAALCSSAQMLASKGEAPITLLGEVQQQGLASILHSTCNGCGEVFSICTSPKMHTPDGNRFEVNVRAVWSQMSTGGGASKLNEQTATLGMPGLQPGTLSKIETEIGNWWKKVLQQEMIKAGMEEKRLAEEANDYHEGVPSITVVLDAGWSKMSHKHTYNAPGGVGIVVGKRTKKLLYIGVKVKTCILCTRAENQGKKPKPHECGQNYTGSSQAMEASIFLDAFSECESVHGVRYMRIIGDGDSNTLAKLVAEGPMWCKQIEKVECANHACKCLRGSLEKLVEDFPHFKGRKGLSKIRRVKISTGVRCAIKMRSKEIEKIGKVKAVKKLQQDIKNSLYHVFGQHAKCSKDFCKERGTSDGGCNDDSELNEDDEDVFSELIDIWESITNEDELENSRTDCGTSDPLDKELVAHVSIILGRLVSKADKLIENHTSNLAENWMAIRSKFDGGKKINRCQRLSWHWRCYGAGLWRNLGSNWSALVWEMVTGLPATVPLWKFGQRQQKNIKSVAKSQAKPEVKRRAKLKKLRDQKQATSKSAKKAYGPQAEQIVCEDDISPEVLQQKCSEFYTKCVKVSTQQVTNIEKATRLQSACGTWYNEKRKRLTASNFGAVMRRNPKIKVLALVRQLVYPTFRGNAHTNNGLQQEYASQRDYEAKQSKESGKEIKVLRCGLFISETHPFLGASPDGIVTVDGVKEGLFEVKNVLKNKPVTFESQALNQDVKFCLEMKDSKLSLSRQHEYYYQVQGQLNVCQYKWADFVVRSTYPYQIHVERIFRDDKLWTEKMLPKLTAFFHKAVLPELAVPRSGKLPGIREPGQWVNIFTQ